MPFLNLDKLLVELSGGAIYAQKLMNKGYLAQQNEWIAEMERVPSEGRFLLSQTAPSLQIIRNFEVTVKASVSVVDITGFSIQALPINVSYFVQHRIQTEQCSLIKIQVQQVHIHTSHEENNHGS